MQHGCSGGYYIAFFYGGFVQTVGRLCRAHFRSLLIPADIDKNDIPPATVLKTIYDILGTLFAVMCMNFTAMPFMLLTISNSLKGWANVGWYGVVLVGGAMTFFYGGGSHYLKKVQANRVKKLDALRASSSVSSGAVTPGRPLTMPPVDIPLEEVDRKL